MVAHLGTLVYLWASQPTTTDIRHIHTHNVYVLNFTPETTLEEGSNEEQEDYKTQEDSEEQESQSGDSSSGDSVVTSASNDWEKVTQ